MSINPISTQNNGYHTNSARSEENTARSEAFGSSSDKFSFYRNEGKDTFEPSNQRRNSLKLTDQNAYGASWKNNAGTFNSAMNQYRAENTREPDMNASDRVRGSGLRQYERTASEGAPMEGARVEGTPLPGWAAHDVAIPETNAEKLYAEIRAVSQEPHSEEKLAKWTSLIRLHTVERLKEQGVKPVTGDDYEERLNAALNSTTYTVANEPTDTDSNTTPSQDFGINASDFLADAAAKLLNAGEGISFSDLGIDNGDFVQKMLDAFGAGEHSSDDFDTLMSQSEALIREFAAQISNNQEPDINSLATELTINGANTTIGQLLTR